MPVSFVGSGGMDANPKAGVMPSFGAHSVAPVGGIAVVPTIVDVNQAFVLTIGGDEFFNNAYHPTLVNVGGVAVVPTSYTKTSIVATFPSGIGTIGVKAISISYSDGDVEPLTQTMTINALPVITSISTVPDPVTASTLFSISVHGTGFHTPAGRVVTAVKVGTTAGLITLQSGTIATASFASGLPAAVYPVSLTFSNGTVVTAVATLTVIP